MFQLLRYQGNKIKFSVPQQMGFCLISERPYYTVHCDAHGKSHKLMVMAHTFITGCVTNNIISTDDLPS